MDGNSGSTDSRKTGGFRKNEDAGSDEMGWVDK